MKLKFLSTAGYVVALTIAIFFTSPELFSQIQQQWLKEYNGPGINKADLATAICADAIGNIYVTGTISEYGDDLAYATIKYNNQGVIQWLSKFHDSTNFQSS